jgi:hypothetical protein
MRARPAKKSAVRTIARELWRVDMVALVTGPRIAEFDETRVNPVVALF